MHFKCPASETLWRSRGKFQARRKDSNMYLSSVYKQKNTSTYCTPHYNTSNRQRHELSMYVLICGELRCLLWTVPNAQVGRDEVEREGFFLSARSVVSSWGGEVVYNV